MTNSPSVFLFLVFALKHSSGVLQASQHHLAALTAAGQVLVWRNQHGNIHTRCDEWEHISDLEGKGVVLIDIGGPDINRKSAGYSSVQEDQVQIFCSLMSIRLLSYYHFLLGTFLEFTTLRYDQLTIWYVLIIVGCFDVIFWLHEGILLVDTLSMLFRFQTPSI